MKTLVTIIFNMTFFSNLLDKKMQIKTMLNNQTDTILKMIMSTTNSHYA